MQGKQSPRARRDSPPSRRTRGAAYARPLTHDAGTLALWQQEARHRQTIHGSDDTTSAVNLHSAAVIGSVYRQNAERTISRHQNRRTRRSCIRQLRHTQDRVVPTAAAQRSECVLRVTLHGAGGAILASSEAESKYRSVRELLIIEAYLNGCQAIRRFPVRRGRRHGTPSINPCRLDGRVHAEDLARPELFCHPFM